MKDKPTKQPRADDSVDKKRLAPYGISLDSVLPEGLSVPPGKKLRLSTERGKRTDTGYVYLSPKSIDDVKRWIGVPDELAAHGGCRFTGLPGISIVKEPHDLRKLKPAEMRGLRDLGLAYVHGDSRLVAWSRSLLDGLVTEASIVGVFVRHDIDIYPGAVLEIGGGIRLLWARDIRIWHGGTLRIEGDTRIDCVNILGGVRSSVPGGLDRYRAPLGVLTTLEVHNA